MMHLENSSIDLTSAREPEITHWLLKGKAILKHRGLHWIRIKTHDGKNNMILCPDDEVYEAVKMLGNYVEVSPTCIRLEDEALAA